MAKLVKVTSEAETQLLRLLHTYSMASCISSMGVRPKRRKSIGLLSFDFCERGARPTVFGRVRAEVTMGNTGTTSQTETGEKTETQSHACNSVRLWSLAKMGNLVFISSDTVHKAGVICVVASTVRCRGKHLPLLG